MEILYSVVGVLIFTSGYVLCYYKGGRYVPRLKQNKSENKGKHDFVLHDYSNQLTTLADVPHKPSRPGKKVEE